MSRLPLVLHPAPTPGRFTAPEDSRATPRRLHSLSTFVAALLVAGCAGGEDTSAEGGAGAPAAAEPTGTVIVSGVGFATPESALHDPATDVYLVSNINGLPLDPDGNGFISRVDPSGEVLELRWIDGAADGVTLNAPKGMALSDGLLYVSDIDCIRMFDAGTGAPAGEHCVEGATFLNDVAPHPDGGVVFTDTGMDAAFESTGADAVYHLAGGSRGTAAEGVELGRPNGIAIDGREALVVTFGTGEVFRIAEDGSRETVASTDGGQLDGVEVLDDGTVLISDWSTSCVSELTSAGDLECRIPDVEAPADIGYDAARQRVLIPLFNANELHIVPWTGVW